MPAREPSEFFTRLDQAGIEPKDHKERRRAAKRLLHVGIEPRGVASWRGTCRAGSAPANRRPPWVRRSPRRMARRRRLRDHQLGGDPELLELLEHLRNAFDALTGLVSSSSMLGPPWLFWVAGSLHLCRALGALLLGSCATRFMLPSRECFAFDVARATSKT